MEADAADEGAPLKRARTGSEDGVLDAMGDAVGAAVVTPAPGAGASAAAALRATAEAALRRGAAQKHMDSVLKLYVMQAEPNYAQPWQVRPQRASTGSGFVLEGKRLLTNAHVVLSCTTVHVRREGRPKKFPARVLCCAPAVDLALLTVDDDAFWENLAPLSLAEVPHLQDSVVVVGYPVGGDSICVTKGVVSRVDLRPYVAGGNSLLTVQIDAAINPGNSGGPAFSDIQAGLVVGVAFSKLRNSDNIGYIIPAPVVLHFLDEFARFGAFRGVAARGFQWQKLENAALRARHGVPGDASGVLLARLDPLAPSSGALQPRDILLSVEGVPIADDGTVAFRGAERLDFTHLWRQRHVGDTLRAAVLRGGARTEVAFTVSPPRPLVPIMHTVDCSPSYYIVGGLVFLPLSVPFLEHGYGASWRKVTPVKLQALLAEYRTAPDEEVVLLFQILSAELNYGYKGTSLWVSTFNGVKVRNLAQMASLVEGATGPYLEWETDDGSCIVLEREAAAAASAVILAQHAIANDRSADLRASADATAAAAAAAAMEVDGKPTGEGEARKAAGTPPPSQPPAPPAEASDNSAPGSRGDAPPPEDAAAAQLSALPPLESVVVPETLFDHAVAPAAPPPQLQPLSQSQRPGDAIGDFGAAPRAALPSSVPAAAATAAAAGLTSPMPVFAHARRQQASSYAHDAGGHDNVASTAPF